MKRDIAMLIEDKNDLFLGCQETLREDATRLVGILKRDPDIHNIIMCLSSMAHLARCDLMQSLETIEDMPGLRVFLGESIGDGLRASIEYMTIATKGGSK